MINQKTYYVYKIIHILNNSQVIRYIGKTYQGSSREQYHFSGKGTQKIHKYMLKHGMGDFTFQRIQGNFSETQAFALETQLILFYGRKSEGFGRLLNLTDGGKGLLGTSPLLKPSKNSPRLNLEKITLCLARNGPRNTSRKCPNPYKLLVENQG